MNTMTDNMDLSEKTNDETHEWLEDASDINTLDFSTHSKKDLLKAIKDLQQETDVKKIDKQLKQLRLHYSDKVEKEKEEALVRFIEEGGKKEDFDYHLQPTDVSFEDYYKLIRERRNKIHREWEEKKLLNLSLKLELLNDLRKLNDGEDSPKAIEQFRAIQRKWNEIGAVPVAHNTSLWASYHALVDRFYDKRTIYFELKELDRKRNAEHKLSLCQKAEELLQLSSIHEAIHQLNDLHREYKETGPVPDEEKEIIWARFKAASDAIHHKRDEVFALKKKEWQANIAQKVALASEMEPFSSFQADTASAWVDKTKEILELQKKWDAVGTAPIAEVKEINKNFWHHFKAFFHNKNVFFKGWEDTRKQMQVQLDELVKEAKEMQTRTDWDEATDAFKKLQQRWHDLPGGKEKFHTKSFRLFKKACDVFFEEKRKAFQQVFSEQEENLKKKEQVIESMQREVESKATSKPQYDAWVAQYKSIGFVPHAQIKECAHKWDEVVRAYLQTIPDISSEERESEKLVAWMEEVKRDSNPAKKIQQKELQIRRRINQLEDEAALLVNNLDFFRHSKNADALRKEVSEKVEDIKKKIQACKQQIKLIAKTMAENKG